METVVKKAYRNTGFTLAGVIVFLILATLVCEGALRQLASYLRVEKLCRIQMSDRTGYTHSLAWSLTLLETGEPPESPYSCRMVSPVDPNDVFVATFVNTAGIHYSIDVRPATQQDSSLPLAPETFADSGADSKPGKSKNNGKNQGSNGGKSKNKN